MEKGFCFFLPFVGLLLSFLANDPADPQQLPIDSTMTDQIRPIVAREIEGT